MWEIVNLVIKNPDNVCWVQIWINWVAFYSSSKKSLNLGFCRKNNIMKRTELYWASLCRQAIELFKNSLIGRLVVLTFSEHMM